MVRHEIKAKIAPSSECAADRSPACGAFRQRFSDNAGAFLLPAQSIKFDKSDLFLTKNST